jgi:hypothetical protein
MKFLWFFTIIFNTSIKLIKPLNIEKREISQQLHPPYTALSFFLQRRQYPRSKTDIELMKIYLKLISAATFIAFILMKKANFKLEPDNVGLFVSITIIALIYHYLSKSIITRSTSLSNIIQSAIASS